jgi:hypothetical protein
MIRPGPLEIGVVVIPSIIFGTIVGALATWFGLHLARKRKQEPDERLKYQQAPKDRSQEQTGSDQTKEEPRPQ